ncbi:SDH family Clp fold serine proteinase [Tahibacter amnicola]|uniref:Serine dehydrogenase proteinase n=1 Tax=Tahibacter amnicola TaxID=2976241 RepID=A0ABY6BC80_9GAMM|nr:hypothetical protein [Tahibacter amnicola]UXI66236.1 hypothetical protein N4264_15925 [Tahibacter amnicola]
MDASTKTGFTAIARLESLVQTRVLVLAATSLDIDLLPAAYESLRSIGPVERLCVVVNCRGGSVNVARRIALLFREFATHVTFVVPHFCESAGTVMALSADEIVAGPLAVFSPTDPHLNAENAGSGPSALSSQDIRLFWQMSHDWFGMEKHDARQRALPQLCDSIFPTTLTSLYRCTREVQDISNELLALALPDRSPEQRSAITDTLLFGFHSHTYALTGDDLARLGLPMARQADVESLSWEIACEIRTRVGGGSRTSMESDWCDALFMTSTGGLQRRRSVDSPNGCWEPVGVA